LTPNELILPFGGFYVCAILVKNNQEMQLWECSQTDRYTDRRKPILHCLSKKISPTFL